MAYASDRAGEGNLDIWLQQTTGGAAIRLTSDPANDREPDVSPDGALVAFRSDRTPRGIYVMPALGGDARFIAPDGMVPRFSPDGRSIAFWTGNWLAPRGLVQPRRVFVIAAAGGDPRHIAADLAGAGDPIWSPDGRALLVFGRRANAAGHMETDWWWVPLDDGAIAQTSAYEHLRAQGLEIENTDMQPYPSVWTASGVLFSAVRAGGGPNLNLETAGIWRIAIDAATGRVAGNPVQLTAGTTADRWPTASRDGRLVFAATTARLALLPYRSTQTPAALPARCAPSGRTPQ